MTYSADDVTGGVNLTSTAQVAFHGSVSQTNSSVVANPISVADNGSASSTITVTLEDGSGTPIPSQTVTLSQGAGHSTITTISGVTNIAGQATFSAVDSTSEVVTYSADDVTGGVNLTSTAQVAFHGALDLTCSSVVANPTRPDNGDLGLDHHRHPRRHSKDPIPGQTVTLSQNSGAALDHHHALGGDQTAGRPPSRRPTVDL